MTTPSLRRLAISLAGLALVAGPAWSSRVVQVRIGNHPTFTRVVFELDAKAGYQIERRDVDGEQELVVTLAAASTPRKLSSRSAMITGVEVEPSGKDSVARVRLRRSAPLVKEMILASPPRIVLDLMLPEDLVGATGAPKPAPTAATAPKTTEEPAAPAPRVVAKKDAPAVSRPRPEPAKPGTKGGSAPEPGPAPKPAAPVVKATPPDAAAAPPQKVEPPAPSPRAVAAPPAPTPVASVETALEGERIVEATPALPDAADETETAEVTPAPVAPARPEPIAPVAKPLEGAPPKPIARAPAVPAPTVAKPGFFSAPFGLSLKGSDPRLTMALVGAGALLFLIVVVMLLRKHSRPTSLDALAIARQAGDPLEAGDSFRTAAASGAGAGFGAQRDAFPTAGPGLFDEDSDKGDMEMTAQLPIERERARMAQAPTGADSDLGPLVRELERRMGQLESRLDQANEARERLERQVTAQSEELRVQRAAIARTQRALRGMSRGGEEQATEPALRDPSKPTSPRS